MEEKMNKPDISPHFTTEDIHKIREWNFERRKGMSREEELADIRRGAVEFERLLANKSKPCHKKIRD